MPEEPDSETSEMEAVVRRRRREALEAGMSRLEAGLYAESEIGTEELRHLVELECPADLLAGILL